MKIILYVILAGVFFNVGATIYDMFQKKNKNIIPDGISHQGYF